LEEKIMTPEEEQKKHLRGWRIRFIGLIVLWILVSWMHQFFSGFLVIFFGILRFGFGCCVGWMFADLVLEKWKSWRNKK
jgi:hypothetical protein